MTRIADSPMLRLGSIQIAETILAMLLLLTLIFAIRTVLEAFRSDLSSLPGPTWAPFTKLYRVYRLWSGKAQEVYLQLHEEFGPIVRTGPNTVSISDVGAVTKIYGINSDFIKSRFYDTMTPYHEGKLMESLFSTRDNAYHRKLKRPVAAKFSMTSIKTLESLADECTVIFIKAMNKHQGEKVDMGAWLQWYAFDVIGAITFNNRFGFMEQEIDVNGMIAGLDMILKYCSIIGQMPELHPWLIGNAPLMSFISCIPLNIPDPLRTMVKFTQECIDRYDSEGEQGDKRLASDFLTWFRLEEQKNKENMPKRDLMNHLSNNLIAGSDTTAISLRSVFYFVVRSPQVYRRLQQEIDDADKAGKLSQLVTYAESLELEYLQVVIKEAMRCHPGVSYPLERLVPEGGAEICGTQLRAGTVVGINPIGLHFNKSIFGQDASDFRPERWLDGDLDQVQMNKSLLSFGSGTRSCIGKNISLMEMGKFVPQIMREFDLVWASDKPDWTVKTYWFAKQFDFYLRLNRREK